MHSTPHKAEACELKLWERRNADRVCEHGDSVLLRSRKKAAKKARRRDDKREQ